MPHFQRVNGKQLASMKGRSVCILGKLSSQKSDTEFEIISADNQPVQVRLKMPIRDNLSDIVEVYGTIDAKGQIICTNYATFDDQVTSNFDMNLYNEALDMMTQMPKYYIQASSY